MKIALLTTLAMLAFATNSVLCRWALVDGHIDPLSFASMRVLSGALLLILILGRRGRRRAAPGNRDWLAVIALFAYLLSFSFAYVSLEAGSGALILFGAAQLTMLFVSRERASAAAWLGSMLALAGLVYLLWPGLSAPPLIGGALMAIAGLGWGIYSLRGRQASNALHATAYNFLMVAPLTVAATALTLPDAHWSWFGIALAVASGTVASALGYIVWYTAVARLSAVTAATVQLSVPALAAAGGIALLGETPTTRLVLASFAILGGIGLAATRPRSSATSA